MSNALFALAYATREAVWESKKAEQYKPANES